MSIQIVVSSLLPPTPKKGVHLLIPRSCENVSLWQRRIQVADGIQVPDQGLSDGKIILDFPGGSNIITKFLLSGRGRQKGENEWNGTVRRIWQDHDGLKMEWGHEPKNAGDL